MTTKDRWQVTLAAIVLLVQTVLMIDLFRRNLIVAKQQDERITALERTVIERMDERKSK